MEEAAPLSVELIISKTNNGYRISSDNIAFDKERVAEIVDKGKIRQPGYFHRVLPLNCDICKAKNIISKLSSS